jgi:predicted dehydrogenase
MPSLKLAVVGFRHGHIHSVMSLARRRQDLQIVAVCEEDEETRVRETAGMECAIYDSYEKMLDSEEIDIIAVGDYFGRRGALAIEALQRGKHVLSDKPVCTRLEELDEIERLLAKNHLVLGCQFDMRGNGHFRHLRRLVQEGTIGAVRAINVTGQHPLNYGKRPGWYFEEGKHGGTINDIGAHCFDYLPWITGLNFESVAAARCWNPHLPREHHFKAGGQCQLVM